MKRIMTKASLALMLTMGWVAPAFAVRTVPDEFATIGAALSGAASGEEIRVVNTHVESVDVVINAPVVIRSYAPGFGSVAPGAQVKRIDVVVAGGGQVTLEGLDVGDTAVGGGTDGLPGIDVFGDPVALELINCTVTAQNGAGSNTGQGIEFRSGTDSSLTLTGSTFDGAEENGVFINTVCSLTISASTVSNSGVDGIFFTDSASGSVVNISSTNVNNNSRHGLNTDAQLTLTKTDSTFSANGAAGLSNNVDAGGSQYTVTRCEYNDNLLFGIDLLRPVNVNFIECNFDRNTFEGVKVETPDAAGAVISMADCVIDANGQHGQFGAGIFVDSPNIDLTLTRTSITNTVATENGDGVYFTGNGGGSSITLNGCTLTGNARHGLNTDATITVDGSGSSFDGNTAVGLVVFTTANGTVVDLSNSTFSQNVTDGIQIMGVVDLTLTSCDLFDNGAWGLSGFAPNIAGITDNLSDPSFFTLADCDVTSNSGRGFSFLARPGSVTIEDSLFDSNSENAINIGNGDSQVLVSLARTQVHDGSGTVQDAVFLFNTDATMTNCLLVGGHYGLSTGGPLPGEGGSVSDVTVQYCTISSDDTTSGVLAFSDGSTLSIVNSIVSTTTTLPALEVRDGAIMTGDYNLVRGGLLGVTTGANSITDQLPLFANVAGGDFSLSVGSPAIDAANPIAGIDTDLTGKIRPLPVGGAPDIGAYEFGDSPNRVRNWELY